MAALKYAHEDEMKQVLMETANKVQQYRIKIGNELDLRRYENIMLLVDIVRSLFFLSWAIRKELRYTTCRFLCALQVL